jgi:hypothetical protein
MTRAPLPKAGCFKVSYPRTEWEQVPCTIAPPYPYPARGVGRGNTTGDGNDFAAQVSGSISAAAGSFDSVTGVTSVSDSTGESDFSLQLNANFFTTPVCNGAANPSECQGWQQFVYSNSGYAFMQYWLIDYGTTCPAEWYTYSPGSSETDCYTNSAGVSVPAQPIADLAQLSLTGNAVSGGVDAIILSTGSEMYSAQGEDSFLSLAQGWRVAEFNLFGDCCSTEASFNSGSTIVVRTSVDDGTTNAPACVTEGFTAETNSLTLVQPCCPYGGASPAIEFTESNVAGATATCTPLETVTAPSSPSGPASGTAGTLYSYSTGGASDSLGNPVQYLFYWGDGTSSGWLPTGTASASHNWSAGSYSVAARARSATNNSITSSLSGALTVSVNAVEAVTTPSTPSGVANGMPGTLYSYTTGGAVDNFGNPVQYLFTWGDGTSSGWLPTGTASASHSWSAGSYSVTAQARSATNTSVISPQSGALAVNITAAGVPLLSALTSNAVPTGSGCTAPPSVNTFATTDSLAEVWFLVAGAHAGDQPAANWYAPNGSLYTTSTWSPVSSPSGENCFWSWISIAGASAATDPGTWTVTVNWDNVQLISLTFTIGATVAQFNDVQPSATFFDAANLMFEAGVTTGCVQSSDPATRQFCPGETVTRQEMAAFIVRAVTGTVTPAIYNPTPYFQDVPTSNPFFPHIQKLMDLGITTGCSQDPPLFCPTNTIPRWEMAMFLVRARLALYGASFSYNPTPYFADVPTNVEGNGVPFPFIQRAYDENITNGCGTNPLVYCPDTLVTRGQMASFIMRGLFNETMVIGPTAQYLTGVAPNALSQTTDSQITVTITGVNTNFQNGDTVTVPSGMLTVSDVVVNSATSISATLTVNANAVAGPQALVVTTGGQNITLPMAIKVGTY